VIHVDGYGNAITAFRANHPHEARSVLLGDGRRIPLKAFYGAVAKGSPLAVKGSSGFVEIAVNQGNAAVELDLDRGSQVIIV
jgi:S-adenosyl-L-methionine hydrolase (adenosine-forming)